MPTSTRAARIILYVVLFFVILVGSTSAYAQWQGGRKDDAAKAAQHESDELSRCIGGFRVLYIDGPEARALKALALYGTDSDTYREAVRDFDVDAYEDLNRRARLHPEAFLRECRRRNP